MSQRRFKSSLFVKKLGIYLHIIPSKMNFKGGYFLKNKKDRGPIRALAIVNTKSHRNYKNCGVTTL